MNLLAFSEDDPNLFFVACHDTILCYKLQQPTQSIHKFKPQPEVWFEQEKRRAPINAIRICRLGEDEALLAVDDGGGVYAWFTGNMNRQPLVFQNDESTWGMAAHAEKRYIAVSANNHRITIYKTSTLEDTVLEGNQKTLAGHGHNIPSIDFHDCGDYLASCSIDGTCRIWDIASATTLRVVRNAKNDWLWGIRFIPTSWIMLESSYRNVEMMTGPGLRDDGNPPLNVTDLVDSHMPDLEEDSFEEEEEWDDEQQVFGDVGADAEGVEEMEERVGEMDGDNGSDDAFFSASSRSSEVTEETEDMEGTEESPELERDDDVSLNSQISAQSEGFENDDEREHLLDASILLYTSARDVFLVDPLTGETLDSISHLIHRNQISRDTAVLDRLCMVEFIRELSLLCVGTQAGSIALVSVLK
ncbi:hypothetical protein HDU97_010062 [Phlyctochytrium planicorne]|nr:hypothetical protein HDU97_010062 [Phlyctochytrium planicorne]